MRALSSSLRQWLTAVHGAFSPFGAFGILATLAVSLSFALPVMPAKAFPPASSEGESANAAPIRRIVVEGNRRMATETVLHHLGSRPGEAFDAGRAHAALKTLYATRQFDDVSIVRKGADVHVVLVEAPVLAAVSITGHAALAKDLLVAEAALKAGEPVTATMVKEAAGRIRALYRGKGRGATEVTGRLMLRDGNRADAAFTIVEAAELRIASIAFKGNAGLDARALREAVASTEVGLFDFLGTTSTYDPARVEGDQQLLRDHYRRNGYPDAAVSPRSNF